jgi:hypothetical protein
MKGQFWVQINNLSANEDAFLELDRLVSDPEVIINELL